MDEPSHKMKAPENHFKKALKDGKTQFGCWLNLADMLGTEIAGRAGFDWVLIDAEHGPSGIHDILKQLQVLDGLNTSAIVRVPIGETWIIKRVLDAGAQSVLVPMVETAQEAKSHVRAALYPPIGKRGVGAVARAAQFGTLTDYLKSANDQICMIIQLETCSGLDAIDDILAVDGIDGVFIGPSDLAADMGFLGDPDAPEVQKSILDALKRIAGSGKAAGILSLKDSNTNEYLECGALMLGVASDVLTLNQNLRNTANKWCNRMLDPSR